MAESENAPDLLRQAASPRIAGKADPLPTALVAVLAFFGGGSAGYVVALFGTGVFLVLTVDDPASVHFGHLGALQLNLAALASALFSVAVALALKGRGVLGFVASLVGGISVSLLIGWPWYRRFAKDGYVHEDAVIFGWPFAMSCIVVVLSVVGLTLATSTGFWKPSSKQTSRKCID